MYIYISKDLLEADDEIVESLEEGTMPDFLDMVGALDESGFFLPYSVVQAVRRVVASAEQETEMLLTGEFQKFTVSNEEAAEGDDKVLLLISDNLFNKIREAESIEAAVLTMEETGVCFSMRASKKIWEAVRNENLADSDFENMSAILIKPWEEEK